MWTLKTFWSKLSCLEKIFLLNNKPETVSTMLIVSLSELSTWAISLASFAFWKGKDKSLTVSCCLKLFLLSILSKIYENKNKLKTFYVTIYQTYCHTNNKSHQVKSLIMCWGWVTCNYFLF